MNTPSRTPFLLASLLGLLLSISHAALAQSTGAPARPAAAAQATELPWVDAEVRRVDRSTGKVTLKHGDIPNLDMPGMTMVFQAADPASLASLATGDKVRFTAELRQSVYVAVRIEKKP